MAAAQTAQNGRFQIQEMWGVHHEIKRLLLLGMKKVDIARTLGVTEAMVGYTAASPIVRRELEIMQAARDVDAVNVSKRIQEMCPAALDRLEELLDSQVESIKLRAAQDVLDRGGYAGVQKVQACHAIITRKDLEEIKNRAKEIGLCVSEPSARSEDGE